MVLAGVAGAAILSAPVIRAGAAQTLFRVTAAVTGGVCIAIAVWQWVPLIAIGVGLAGFLLLASLPVILELAERRAGPAGTSATALVWLSGNAGGIVIALLVQAVVHHRLIAFLLMAAVAASVLPFVRADPESVPPEDEPAAVSAAALNRSRRPSGPRPPSGLTRSTRGALSPPGNATPPVVAVMPVVKGRAHGFGVLAGR